jgi:hypothetical protein
MGVIIDTKDDSLIAAFKKSIKNFPAGELL